MKREIYFNQQDEKLYNQARKDLQARNPTGKVTKTMPVSYIFGKFRILRKKIIIESELDEVFEGDTETIRDKLKRAASKVKELTRGNMELIRKNKELELKILTLQHAAGKEELTVE